MKPMGSHPSNQWRVDGRTVSECRRFDGDRAAVRAQSVAHALGRLLALLGAPP